MSNGNTFPYYIFEKHVLSYIPMFEDFEPPNNEQRKFVSNLAIVASIAWASPICNFFISLHLHTIKFSLAYAMHLFTCLFAMLFFLVVGFSILRAIR